MTESMPAPPYVETVHLRFQETVAAVTAETLAAIAGLRAYARETYPSVRTMHLEYSDQGRWLFLDSGNTHDEDPVEMEDQWHLAGNIVVGDDGSVWLAADAWPEGFTPCDVCHGASLILTVAE